MSSIPDSAPAAQAGSATSPTRAASGGQPSAAAASESIHSFSRPVLSRLLTVHKSINPDQAFQDGHRFPDVASFLAYMASTESSAISAPKHNDLSYPLSSYYISSSHNTYLSGHQLYGEASTEAYTHVLLRGCRCLEIDVWDGDSEGDSTSTSSSDNEDDRGHGPLKHGKEGSKPSRWSRIRERAAKISSRSRSSPDRGQGATTGTSLATAGAHPQNILDGGPPAISSSHLSPQPSPVLPEKPEPRVLHGYTLTQSVSFRSVCHAVKHAAFVGTNLPIIVSLEVHASLSQQETMVEIMRDLWAGHLVDISQASESEISALPSPDSLRNKILIKVKRTPQTTGESNNPLDPVNSNTTDAGSEEGALTSSAGKKTKASKVLAALSELGIYTRAYTFRQFSQPEASIPTHVFSLSESKVHNMHSDPIDGPALFDHNKHYLMRIFPKGTRIASSNVDPSFHWRQGAQMVALNWQKLDKGMMLNEGMFADHEGWVLKPEGYRGSRPSQNEGRDGTLGLPVPTGPHKQTLDLEIQLLAAQELPSPAEKEPSRLKPYVKCELHIDTHGPPGQGRNDNSKNAVQTESDAYGDEEKEGSMYQRRSKTYRSDGFDFDGELMTWSNVPDVVDELSFLRYVQFSLRYLRGVAVSCHQDRGLASPFICLIIFVLHALWPQSRLATTNDQSDAVSQRGPRQTSASYPHRRSLPRAVVLCLYPRPSRLFLTVFVVFVSAKEVTC